MCERAHHTHTWLVHSPHTRPIRTPTRQSFALHSAREGSLLRQVPHSTMEALSKLVSPVLSCCLTHIYFKESKWVREIGYILGTRWNANNNVSRVQTRISTFLHCLCTFLCVCVFLSVLGIPRLCLRGICTLLRAWWCWHTAYTPVPTPIGLHWFNGQ